MVATQYVDTEKLNEAIEKSGLRPGFLIEQLGISRQAFDQKKKGVIRFRKSEVLLLQYILKIKDDDLGKIFCFESKPIHLQVKKDGDDKTEQNRISEQTV